MFHSNCVLKGQLDRSLHSKSHLKIGQQVFVSTPIATTTLVCCSACFTSILLKKCSNCKKRLYCSQACQKLDWIAGHSLICSDLKSLDDHDHEEIEMLLKVVICNQSSSFELEMFNTLLGHVYEWDTSLSQRNDAIIGKTQIILAKKNIIVNDDTLRLYLGRFGCNNFSIFDNSLFHLGNGTFPLSSLLNHSCTPNCIITYQGTKQTLIAISEIAAGQELTISYLDTIIPTKKRTERLSKKYFFDCKCRKCVNHDDLLYDREINEEKVLKWIKDQGYEIMKQFSDIVLYQKYSFNNLFQPLFNINTFTIISKLQYDLMDAPETLTLSAYVLSIYILHYPTHHPITNLQLLMYGKLLWNADRDLELARVVLEMALIGFKVVNSTKAQEYLDAKEVLRFVVGALEMK